MIRTLAYPLWMLASVAIAVWLREVAWCVAAGVVGLGVQFAVARAWRTERRTLAVANLLTVFRLAIVAGLPIFLSSLPRLLFVALVIALLVLDGVDGYVARARKETSPFGATFDMETDALSVMVLGLLLFVSGTGAWVLVAGLWRYVLAVAVALVPALGDFPPSPRYRNVFVVLMLAFAGAFVPWASVAKASAAIGTIVVSLSFLHSIVRSRAFRFVRGSAPP